MRSKRKHKQRTFFNPSDSTRKTYMGLEIGPKQRQKAYTYLKVDAYKKDNSEEGCLKKQTLNNTFSSFITRPSRCLILDGKLARTSKTLLKNPMVNSIDVPNFSDAFYYLNRIEGINSYPVCLYDFVTFTKVKYEAIYLDSCGWFEKTHDNSDLKASIGVIISRRLLKQNGVIGLTISKRGDSNQWNLANEYMQENGFKLLYKMQYQSMCTFFYNRIHPCMPGHTLSTKIVGDDIINCDICFKVLKPYNITKHCKSCDIDVCSNCFNEKRREK